MWVLQPICAGHKIDCCPLRHEFKLKGMGYDLSKSLDATAAVTTMENGMNVTGFFFNAQN